MQIKQNIIINFLSLLIMTAITIASLYTKQSTVFYILYLFWFDEFIRAVFSKLSYHFNKKEIEDPVKFRLNLKEKFFFLFVYFVFIFVFFGLVIDRNDFSLIAINFSVLAFQNSFFNFSIITFLLRELYLYRNNSVVENKVDIISVRIVILHISIILGILFWVLSTQKYQFMVEYSNIIAIVPFLLLKLIFEVKLEA